MNFLKYFCLLFVFNTSIIGEVSAQSYITIGPPNAAYVVGSHVELPCYTNATTPTHIWLFSPVSGGTITVVNGCQVTAAGSGTYEVARPDFGSCNLVIPVMDLNTAGLYWCAPADYSPVQASHNIVFESEVELSTDITEPEAEEGDNIEMTCSVSFYGTPILRPYIVWNPPVESPVVFSNFTFIRSSVVVTAVVPYVPVYTCTVLFVNFTSPPAPTLAQNVPSFQSIKSSDVINVFHAPHENEITITGLTDGAAYKGSTLTCHGNGYPPPTYYWHTPDDQLVIGSDVVLTSEGEGLVYVCHVLNTRGGASKTVSVNVLEVSTESGAESHV